MRILVTGSTGLVGSALVRSLQQDGHAVTRLVRREPAGAESSVFWNPETGQIDREGLEGADAVVHLAGENIAARRWTRKQKARIRDSRVIGTRLLAESLAELSSPPAVLVAASGMGFYGDRGEEEVDETSPPGRGFLAELCQQWEGAADPARNAGIRVVHLRIGMVLSEKGGALAKMLPAFRLGLGGVIGSGRQYWSWIALDDLVRIIRHAIENDGLSGPVNAVSPRPVTNRQFTQTLGRILRR
ncbi:MAG: TIGR01777 family protein, partial [Planctomycetes bacterium]|nr:TIGR01777 family protein [Planctomycetota bacterium]